MDNQEMLQQILNKVEGLEQGLKKSKYPELDKYPELGKSFRDFEEKTHEIIYKMLVAEKQLVSAPIMAESEKLKMEFEAKITNLEAKLNENNNRSQVQLAEKDRELEAKLNEKNAELSEKNDRINELINESEKAKEKISIADEFTKIISVYKELRDKICSCKTMEEYCKKNDITQNDSVSELLRFSIIVGTDLDFGREIINQLVTFRSNRNNYFPIQKDEWELYSAFNDFCRKKLGKRASCDVFYLPDGFSVDNYSNVKLPFRLNEMRNIERGRNLRSVTLICAPCFRIDGKEDGNTDQAYVKGEVEEI